MWGFQKHKRATRRAETGRAGPGRCCDDAHCIKYEIQYKLASDAYKPRASVVLVVVIVVASV